jgi:deferrochelatase/peroxidase EfeB
MDFQIQRARLDGSRFVAVQQWEHDTEYFTHMEEEEQDNVFGRRLSNNEEFVMRLSRPM